VSCDGVRGIATGQKVAGWILDGVYEFLHGLNSPGRTTSLGSTQSPTEMSNKDPPGRGGGG
jgi:hypothetical protein